jgi:LacI family transcriptional regulator
VAVRIKDIANDLGISPMAVSKALRDHPDISAETKRRVLERAKELNYRINMVARSMVTGRTFLVGLIVPDLMQSFFAEIAGALADALSPSGYHVLIANSGECAQSEIEDVELFLARNVDALVVASAQREPGRLAALSTPTVMIDRIVPGLKAHFVGSDDFAIGRMATEHLVEQGCRAIVHLAGTDASPALARTAGFREVLSARSYPAPDAMVEPAGYTDGEGYAAMRRLLRRNIRPDGIFCFNDPVAIGAMRAIKEAGLEIPRDVAVVGAANTRYSAELQVPLTTIDQDTTAIGKRTAKLLLESLRDTAAAPRSERVLLPAKLIVRQSSLRRSG